MKKSLIAMSLASCSQVHELTFDAVVSGMTCTMEQSQQMNCEYRIGKSLWINIAGVGQSDAGVSFLKSDFDGDYYGTFGLKHSCVTVWPGKKARGFRGFAFISPRTGKVYRSWPECEAG